MQRKVLGWRLVPTGLEENEAAEYMSGSRNILGWFREKYKLRRWDHRALLKVYAWAGHVARFAKSQDFRLASKVLKYRGVQYLKTLEDLYNSQCHSKRFKVWRWEQQFVRAFGRNWIQLAWEAETWEVNMESWLIGRLHWKKL